MRQKLLSQTIKKVTFGICSALLEVLLLEVKILGALASGERVTMANFQRVLDEELGIVPRRSFSRTFTIAKQKGLLNKHGALTQKGMRRIDKTFPAHYSKLRWDKTWMFVVFDIPEKQRAKRNVLRAYLRRWKFGKLQNSVWVSVHDTTKELLELCVLYTIEPPQILFWKTNNIGMEPKNAAQYIWDLQGLNKRYEEYIQKYSSPSSPILGVLAFLAIAKDDPQLPQELLPTSWKGTRAFELYQKFIHREQ